MPSEHWVLTVPMRNGNREVATASRKSAMGSYRTYEEWKPQFNNSQKRWQCSSYRTYEEWKPSRISAIVGANLWFLPYLWGMETSLGTQAYIPHFSVLTVPMRNGNSMYGTFFNAVSFVFLPYLWGMETSVVTLQRASHEIGSYRTYEEWKHK